MVPRERTSTHSSQVYSSCGNYVRFALTIRTRIFHSRAIACLTSIRLRAMVCSAGQWEEVYPWVKSVGVQCPTNKLSRNVLPLRGRVYFKDISELELPQQLTKL